ncbi:hypothetical protein DUI87_32243 [Hirundo rustica rustica]|uniref:G-protein coupled receptors family 1 profile domain-containing protein n=1 Tax=Hirundo rustica rustica TaxID=333673 RepID=A0A3M0J382_HIRRU|nr:hypothetical protein DUI87_34576 [Hirundo rustica rustica]RMB91451.1 hypothetical protein DUI87_32243 [Hirundo rustica rustica]
MMEPLGEEEERVLKEFEFDSRKLVGELGQDFEGLGALLALAPFAYMKPPSISSPSLGLALSVLYSVVPPALNPLIYSLRNQELKAAVWGLMTA